MLEVKWESLAHKSRQSFLPEGCHALQPVLGRDVLKQQQNISLLGCRARGQLELAQVCPAHEKAGSKSFCCLWTLVLGCAKVWASWLLGILKKAGRAFRIWPLIGLYLTQLTCLQTDSLLQQSDTSKKLALNPHV